MSKVTMIDTYELHNKFQQGGGKLPLPTHLHPTFTHSKLILLKRFTYRELNLKELPFWEHINNIGKLTLTPPLPPSAWHLKIYFLFKDFGYPPPHPNFKTDATCGVPDNIIKGI